MVKDAFLHNGGQRNTLSYVVCSNCSTYFNSLIGPNPSYLVLTFGNNLPINNRDMAQKVISQRSMSLVKTNGTIRILDLKNTYQDAKIVILRLKMGDGVNTSWKYMQNLMAAIFEKWPPFCFNW